MATQFAASGGEGTTTRTVVSAMRHARLGVGCVGLPLGFLGSGFFHLDLLWDRAYTALARSNASPLLFAVKPIGETFGGLFFLYLCATVLLLLVAAFAALFWLSNRGDRRQRGMRKRPTLPSPAAMFSLLAGLSPGAAGSAVFNLLVTEDIYASSLAYEEYFAVASASALPEMRTLTFVYLAFCLTLFCSTVAIGIFRAARHR